MKYFLITVFVCIISFFSIILSEVKYASAQSQYLSKSPTSFNINLGTAGTETDYTFPHNTTRMRITPRGGSIKFSWTNGASGTTYTTIPQGISYCQGGVLLSAGSENTTIHLQGTVNGTVAEIELWR